jgi:putative ABC transport system permease protein
VEPLVIVIDAGIILPGVENINFANTPIPKLMIRLAPGNMKNAVEEVNKVWNKLTNSEEFSFSFVDQAIDAQYASDQNLGKIIGISTLLAVILGSIGLYGLATLSMQNKVKEISVRKVFGASSRALFYLLTKEYVVMVIIALIISIPFSIYAMREWLSGFEYRVELKMVNFLIAGGIALGITLFTILYQTLVTANSKPAETLRNE